MRWSYLLIALFIASPSRAGIIRQNVRHFSKSGSTGLIGDVTISEGSNITLTQSGQNITIAATGGSSTLASATKTANYSITNADDVIIADGTNSSFTLSLTFSASATIKPYRIKFLTTGKSITVAAQSGDSIDGDASETINITNTALELIPDGSKAWHVY